MQPTEYIGPGSSKKAWFRGLSNTAIKCVNEKNYLGGMSVRISDQSGLSSPPAVSNNTDLKQKYFFRGQLLRTEI